MLAVTDVVELVLRLLVSLAFREQSCRGLLRAGLRIIAVCRIKFLLVLIILNLMPNISLLLSSPLLYLRYDHVLRGWLT